MENSTLKWFANRISHGGLVSKKQFNELVDEAHQKITNEFIQARIEENESMLEYAKTHGDARMVLVLTDRINDLKSEVENYIDASETKKMFLQDLENKLNTSGKISVRYHEDSIMAYGKICHHDNGYLCEHRRLYIMEMFKKHI